MLIEETNGLTTIIVAAKGDIMLSNNKISVSEIQGNGAGGGEGNVAGGGGGGGGGSRYSYFIACESCGKKWLEKDYYLLSIRS